MSLRKEVEEKIQRKKLERARKQFTRVVTDTLTNVFEEQLRDSARELGLPDNATFEEVRAAGVARSRQMYDRLQERYEEMDEQLGTELAPSFAFIHRQSLAILGQDVDGFEKNNFAGLRSLLFEIKNVYEKTRKPVPNLPADHPMQTTLQDYYQDSLCGCYFHLHRRHIALANYRLKDGAKLPTTFEQLVHPEENR